MKTKVVVWDFYPSGSVGSSVGVKRAEYTESDKGLLFFWMHLQRIHGGTNLRWSRVQGKKVIQEGTFDR